MASIKLDVIYYKTSSDFEFEFNLSGCAGVRLFKEKVETPKALVTSLARDVARSRIIIIVTDFEGENSGVPIISKAIRLPVVPADKKAYHISTEGDCNIFIGATPLVTKNGVFVGFVAESGPQSIIVLTSDRTLRHEIMNSYVHKYIFDIAQAEAYTERFKTPCPPACEETPAQKEEDIISITPIDIAPGTTITPPEPIQIKNDDEKLNKRLPTKSNTANIILLIIVVLLLIAFGVLAYLFIYIPLLNGETPFLSSEIIPFNLIK